MTCVVNVQEAKTRLSELLHLVEAGEQVVIARAGRPVAHLQAVEPRKRSFEEPLLAGIPPLDINDVLAPTDESTLSSWEDGHTDDPLT